MSALKYKWKVMPEPTGRFRSFEKRMWPEAVAADGTKIAQMDCEDDYMPRRVRANDHGPITIRVRARNDQPGNCKWKYLRLVNKASSLDEAKAMFKRFVQNFPNHDFALESDG